MISKALVPTKETLIQNRSVAGGRSLPAADSQENRSWKKHLGHWGAYAAASGAALAMSTNASAGIIYSGIINDTALLSSFPASGSGDHQIDDPFSINPRLDYNAAQHAGTAQMRGSMGAFSSGPGSDLYFAKRYVAGASIVGGSHRRSIVELDTFRSGVQHGNFLPSAGTEFLGFEWGGRLGWMQVELSQNGDGYPDEIDLISFAYQSLADVSIQAGEGIPTPEPDTAALGLLAAGAAGLLALRRRRAARAA